VGIIFLLHAVGTFVFGSLPAFGLLFWANNIVFLQIVNVISMLAAIALLVVWSRYSASSKSFLTQWPFWFMASAIGAVFPTLVLWRQLLVPNTEWLWIIVSVQAVMTAALNFMSQLYHYSAFYYGRPRSFHALDPIGIGLPICVSLVCEDEISPAITELGLPIEKSIIKDVYLIDETDQHYIIALEQFPGEDSGNETIKIGKELVKVIQHKPDNMNKLISK
jgi:hypothetical protein